SWPFYRTFSLPNAAPPAYITKGVRRLRAAQNAGRAKFMDIRISKESEIPLRQQVAEQIVFHIATGKLQPGQALPSVRELARRLKIHHNTVSEAYQDLERRMWVVGRRGSRVTVRALEDGSHPRTATGLDDLINTLIRVAREQGYSLQSLRERVRERLLAAPPDHILVVEADAGLRRLLREEIRAAINWPVEVCSRLELAANPGLGIGALAVAAQYAIPDVNPLLPLDRPAIPLAFGSADEQVEMIRKRREPSVMAVVSVSAGFLQTASRVLATAAGSRHVLQEFLLPLADRKALAAADLVFADSIAVREVKHRSVVPYRLIAPASLNYLSSALRAP
ncbi:MAG: GntR family transcriptional regulator, partial [Terriglobia bacterium]